MDSIDFSWRGVTASSHGVVATQLPAIMTAQLRDDVYSVPGRPGSLHVQDGEYDELIFQVICYIPYEQGVTASPIKTIKSWLTGYDWVSFTAYPDRKFRAHIISMTAYNEWVPGYDDREFTVTFNADPYAYHTGIPDIVKTTSPISVPNPGTAYAAPIITMAGSGDITLMVNGKMITLTGVPDSVTINSDIMETYKNATNLNAIMDGDYPILTPGANLISWTGTVTSVTISPNWRDI